MLSDAPIVAFVPTARPAAAREFYVDVLGLRLTGEDQFALTFDAGGTTLRLAKVEQLEPVGYTVLGWTVGDVASVVADLVTRGVRFERFPFLNQAPDGIWKSPSGARVAWFKDPDGNTLSVTELPSPP